MTEKAALLSRFGATNVTLSSANTFSYAKRDMLFRDYVEVRYA